jgi:hypothetical protein
MVRLLALLPLLLMPSCREQSVPPVPDAMPGDEVALGDDRGGLPAARNPVPDPPPPPPLAADFADLSPLSRAEIERELESGAGCSIDGPLLVAVDGDAIVKEGGRVRHLKPEATDLQALFRGGRFVGEGLVVEVRRELELKRQDELISWQATLDVKRGRRGYTTYHMQWSCGA